MDKAKTRIMAEWCEEVPVDEHGESNWDQASYVLDGPYETEIEAANVADERDVFGEGMVVVEQYAYITDGIWDWEEIERRASWQVREAI